MLDHIDIEVLKGGSALRRQVRDFVETETFHRTPETWDSFNPDFSRKVAAEGWIGMTWPKRYGGGERSALERYVITEELLAAGAPVRAHWAADRQIGPILLAAGSEYLKELLLPRIAAGECFFCIGMSEPNSGSDLASIRTKASKADGGWLVSGQKVWSGYAHRAHYMNLFARTSPFDKESRHKGVTQFVLDMSSPGITVRPIYNLANDHDFNEVIFDDVFVPDAMLIGEEGDAWGQVSGELAHERAGAERWLGTFGLLTALIDEVDAGIASGDAERIGRVVAQVWTLHRMSLSIAASVREGADLPTVAALVKDMGTELDQAVPEVARAVMTESRRLASPTGETFQRILRRSTLYAPAYSIRGGTREILRGIIARGIGLR
ncbi:acyl-CoA dehydrogenase family protein [Chelativorans sp. AA-79]|uniref:acyl-CoA dehydrogenase family protein n=1 Tax=Chelativorans sp. AA-79 TaxID=3028735 RepID=UPI0023F9BEA2|nr:acyl-CoA dehydrogenase family protein [Chelativorans sp. AA-79]WEX12460.1 acyl-CoA dehydrogenase family protein [Chelativorans sp. AA-79]